MNAGNYDILVLGRMFPMENGEAIRSKARSNMQDAANELQWNLIRGFLENSVGRLSAVSYLPIDSWPRYYRDPFVRGGRETVFGSVDFSWVSFCNITVVKQILNRHACDRAVKAWARNRNGKRKVLICYTRKNILMRSAAAAKKVDPSVRVIQVIADLTEFAVNPSRGGLYQQFVRLKARENRRLEKYADGYVLLTEHMKARLGLDKPCTVMEGIIPRRPAVADDRQQEDTGEKTVLYTGTMNKKYGILELLQAFSLIEGDEYRLVLCGLGNAEPEIREYAARDPRIQYLGKVPHDRVLQMQSRATVLVNPRQNNEEFTKYSFPSKTMEYLASGAPLVAYKLDGIPDEYDGYIRYPADDSTRTLAQTIVEAAQMSAEERNRWTAEAKTYVTENKNPRVQTKRILELIGTLYEEKGHGCEK